MKADQYQKLLAFLDRLDKAKIPYRLSNDIENAISVEAYAPGEHWEIDFLANGDTFVERFRSNGHIDDEDMLEELFALCSDDEPATQEAANRDDAIARK